MSKVNGSDQGLWSDNYQYRYRMMSWFQKGCLVCVFVVLRSGALSWTIPSL
eukprot:COSAG04_NODE_9154_length_893_cov_1.159950_2_plen_50_part_01